MSFDGFRVGCLFALAGAIVGIAWYAIMNEPFVWIGGVFGAIGGVLVWRATLWTIVGGAIVRAVVRWLFRDPYRKK